MNKSEKIFFSIITLIVLFSIILLIRTETKFKYTEYVNCIDGDTFSIGQDYYRLAYMDTPEKNELNYKKASYFACNYLKNNNLIIKNVGGKDIYGRKLVVVRTDNDFLSLNELLVKNCLAEPYYLDTTDTIKNLFNNCK